MFRPRIVRAAAERLTRLPVALAIGTAAFWLWHMPPLYEPALRERVVHDFEHLTIIAGALVM